MTKTSDITPDKDGFVRKKRSLFGFVYLLAVIASNFYIPDISLILVCVLSLIPTYFSYLAIDAFSSHDFSTWKHSTHVKLWIYSGCYFSILLGVVVYYYLKWKEKRYLTNPK